jgi:hypothetical protein
MLRRKLLACLVVLAPRTLAAAPEPFSFVVPDGFVDISDGEKPPLSPIGDHFFDYAKTHDFMAVKLLDGAVVAALAAKVGDGRAPLTSLASGVSKAQPVLPPDTSFKVLGSSTVKLAGVDCGRVEAERLGPDENARILVFVLPSAERWAQIELAVFDTRLYAEVASAVEAALARTRGIAPVKEPDAPPTPVFALIGVGALVGTLVGKAIRGRKRSTKWRQRRSTKDR